MKRSTATLLAFLAIAFLVVNSASYYFYQPLSEIGDAAANSICIIRAKHFAQLYGCYSRWGFYHPGPALFYLQGWGEGLLFDWLHLCPTPYNAQRLTQLCMGSCFFVMALRTFTLWLPRGPRRGWFLAGALAFAAFHFADDRRPVFLSNWPAYPPVLLMLCLLTMGAAVAAGYGEELPSLALSGGFLIHLHVAQPLFVLPLTFLAYLGLLWQCASASPESTSRSQRQRWMRSLGAGWRTWPRAHFMSVGLLVIFAVPLLIDACRGADSNLTAIWHHLCRHRGERKTWLRSLLYFLQFGTYAYYGGAARTDFGHYDRAGVLAYLRAHTLILTFWLGIAATALSAVARQIPLLATRRHSPDPAGEYIHPSASTSTRHFLAWASIFLGAAIALTLYWGTIQDGLMAYYNAFFNYGIYYFGALIALAVLCSQPFFASCSPQNRWVNMGTRLLPILLAVAACGLQAKQLRLSPAQNAEFNKNVLAFSATMVPATPSAPVTPKLLLFPHADWPQAMGVAIQLYRRQMPFFMLDPYKLMVGEEHVWRYGSGDRLQRGLQVCRLYRLTDASAASRPDATSFPLVPPLYLSVAMPVIDPANPAGTTVIDYLPGRNASAYTVFGWSTQEAGGTWSDGHEGLLAFAPKPVEGRSIEVQVEATPFLVPARGLSVQRLRLFFDGEALADVRTAEAIRANPTPLKFVIPAALWNRAATRKNTCATLDFEWPDAAMPASLDPNGHVQDRRFLAWWFHTIYRR